MTLGHQALKPGDPCRQFGWADSEVIQAQVRRRVSLRFRDREEINLMFSHDVFEQGSLGICQFGQRHC